MSEVDPGALRALALAVRRNGRTDHDLFRSRALELAEAVVTLLAERAKDGEALTAAKAALDAAEVALRESRAMARECYASAECPRESLHREVDRLRTSLGEVMAERNEARVALVAMTETRDEACRILDGCIRDLAEHEEDPSMMDGHREIVARLRAVGGR